MTCHNFSCHHTRCISYFSHIGLTLSFINSLTKKPKALGGEHGLNLSGESLSFLYHAHRNTLTNKHKHIKNNFTFHLNVILVLMFTVNSRFWLKKIFTLEDFPRFSLLVRTFGPYKQRITAAHTLTQRNTDSISLPEQQQKQQRLFCSYIRDFFFT